MGSVAKESAGRASTFEGSSSEMRDPNSPWLASEDILDKGDVPVTIEGVYKHIDAKFQDGRKETIFALGFKGKKKRLVLNATNRRTLVNMFKTSDTMKWVGERIALYVDPNVKAFGDVVCGIRIRKRQPGRGK